MNYLPILGWLIDLFFKISLAVPFWFFWTFIGIGEKYFFFLPTPFHHIPFWHTVGMFVAIPILLNIITPKFVTVSNEQTVKTRDSQEE